MRTQLALLGVLGLGITSMAGCGAGSGAGHSSGQVRVEARSEFAGQPDHGRVYPAVTGGFGQQPRVAAGAKDTPTSPTSQDLVVGTGARVTPGVMPKVRYVETDWKTGAVRHDSWADGIASETMPTDQTAIAVLSMLNGVRIGSRVELISPTGNGDATVYVVDILADGTPRASASG